MNPEITCLVRALRLNRLLVALVLHCPAGGILLRSLDSYVHQSPLQLGVAYTRML